MTGTEIRQSFIDFFIEKEHTFVPSSSLEPDDPTLPSFTNAGMNQFVPFFLGREAPPFSPGRATNTQKCIRAGGKHNDLDDVGKDTYHHTFFEMLGNWSFGDYFKKEAIAWAWELLVERWGMPKERLYFSVYEPGDGDPGTADHEARAFWTEICEANGLDPAVHVLGFGKTDNFWMMGDTGPCGPCSEVHIDLTPNGDTNGKLVNADDHRCIEIWNLVFIQNNATVDGRFEALPSTHVDTGMGLERVAAAMQRTEGFTDFSKTVSNYDTDLFQNLFSKLTELTGLSYAATLPTDTMSEQQQRDVAFRVIADHARCLTAAVADGIYPHRDGRGYVLRRIVRRAARYARTLGIDKPFLSELVDVVVGDLGATFPEMVQNQDRVKALLTSEEESFGRTLNRGLALFQKVCDRIQGKSQTEIPGADAFELYDTYGFPYDLTELMAEELGLAVDRAGFDAAMAAQKKRGKDARGLAIVEVADGEELPESTFNGYDLLDDTATVRAVIAGDKHDSIVLDHTPFYPEMGGQVGDKGQLVAESALKVGATTKQGESILHLVKPGSGLQIGDTVTAQVEPLRRMAIQRHHTATHLLHWALREVIGKDSSQRGSFVGDAYLRFDFNFHRGLTTEELRDIERLVNERILENEAVFWFERERDEIAKHPEINQFFGDKYQDLVRVVQIGGQDGALNGYSMELCGGTHTQTTGDLGPFVLRSEAAIAAGTRRVEAVSGAGAIAEIQRAFASLDGISAQLATPVKTLETRIQSLLDNQKRLEKELKTAQRQIAAALTGSFLDQTETINGVPLLAVDVSAQGASPRDLLEGLVQKLTSGVIVLGAADGDACSFVVSVSKDWVEQGLNAGKIAREVAKVAGGGGEGGNVSANRSLQIRRAGYGAWVHLHGQPGL